MIRNLILTNFKAFEQIGIRLGMLTLIAGQNGAGKSTIIQALLLLRQSYTGRIQDFSGKLRLDGSLADLVSAANIRCTVSEQKNVKIEVDDSLMDDDYSAEIEDATIDVPEVDGVFTDNYIDAMRKTSLFDDNFIYLYANRLSPQRSYHRANDHYTNSRLGDRSGNMSVFFLQKMMDQNETIAVEGMRGRNARSLDVAENVSVWMSHIMGDSVRVKPADEGNGTDVRLVYSLGMEERSPLNMAFGDTYILPVLLAVLTAPAGSLIIIENPEAHLHPSAQRKMGEFLALAAANGIQIILETHSDHLLNGVRLATKKNTVAPDQVVVQFVYQKGDAHLCQEVELREDGSLDKWPAGFFNEWESVLMKLNDVE